VFLVRITVLVLWAQALLILKLKIKSKYFTELNMEIISHRGFWLETSEKNKRTAFQRSFELGLGTETDIRDLDGQLVISHDMPKSCDNLLKLDDFFEIYLTNKCKGTLALNIKSDGLQADIKASIEKYSIENYVLFDMSIPDALVTCSEGLKYLSRVSNYESDPIFLENSSGIWMDDFVGGWISSPLLETYLQAAGRVFVVSSELHGRDPKLLWNVLKSFRAREVILCTDRPVMAAKYIGGNFD
jgi:hypothetical protein